MFIEGAAQIVLFFCLDQKKRTKRKVKPKKSYIVQSQHTPAFLAGLHKYSSIFFLQISSAKTKNCALRSSIRVPIKPGNFLWSPDEGGGFAFEICDSFGYFSSKEK
jgi:hypothetical protein